MSASAALWAVRMRTPDGTHVLDYSTAGMAWRARLTTLTWCFEETEAAAEAVAADLRHGARRGTTVWIDPPRAS